MSSAKNKRLFFISRVEEFCSDAMIENREFHLHDYYTIFYLTKGEAVHSTNYIEYILEPDSILFVPPDLEHSLVIGNGCTGFHIAFDRNFFDFKNKCDDSILKSELFSNPDFYTIIKTDEATAPRFMNVIATMSEEQKKRSPYHEEISLNCLMIFLYEAKRLHELQYPAASATRERGRILLQFKQLIETHYMSAHDVSFYAGKLSMSSPQLNFHVKRLTGITAGEYIRNKILNEAKKLIYKTGLSSKEISFRLGFMDPAYFSRFFKKHTGSTLNDFKKSVLEKYNKSN